MKINIFRSSAFRVIFFFFSLFICTVARNEDIQTNSEFSHNDIFVQNETKN